MEKTERKPLYNHEAEGFMGAAGFDANAMSQVEFAQEMAKTLHLKIQKSSCPSEFTEDLIYSAIEGDRVSRYFILEAVTKLVYNIGEN